tara:strand:- start:353 stop:523 length:171 start_codon:yes stop_codon:yes gene_type:complete
MGVSRAFDNPSGGDKRLLSEKFRERRESVDERLSGGSAQPFCDQDHIFLNHPGGIK